MTPHNECNFIYLADNVSNCHSFIFHMKLNEYLTTIEIARINGGNIEGQRQVLKSQSAKIIREQMTSDFKNGGVLPPVVIGIVDQQYDISNIRSSQDICDYLNKNKENLCIIDGMQRTEAMLRAGEETSHREIRVELWLVRSLNKLIYRMLVLNTGQVPWTMQRQLEVVMIPVVKCIINRIPDIELPTTNDEQRRTQAGKFQASRILESFLVFGSRSERANTRDSIAEEYAKLDFIESASKQDILDIYVEFLKRIVALDYIIERVNPKNDHLKKFKKGIDILGSQPALIGITTAFGIKILGRPKLDYSQEKQINNTKRILTEFDNFLKKLAAMSDDEIDNFLNLPALNSMSPSSASTKVGDQERIFFRSAFNVLIEENFDVPNMDVCWGH